MSSTVQIQDNFPVKHHTFSVGNFTLRIMVYWSQTKPLYGKSSAEPNVVCTVFETKEIEIVHRLFLVKISYCVRTRRVKQKQKLTKVFTNLLRGFVDSYRASSSI